uniref:Uncharacterized protein n=1 Tax=Arundo donax TaxID=35708 RepID=A0A0A8YEH6_ARUDO
MTPHILLSKGKKKRKENFAHSTRAILNARLKRNVLALGSNAPILNVSLA